MINPKPVLMTLHGIRTRGLWQKALAEVASANDIIVVPSDFGRLPLAGFIWQTVFGGKAEWFLREYERLLARHHMHLGTGPGQRLPSLVAHSFGTFIAGYSMLKHEHIRFAHVIFCGTILPEDFPWDQLFLRNQVGDVRNDFGARDWPVRLCGHLLPRTGHAGVKGFQYWPPAREFDQEQYEHYSHSDFFSQTHMEKTWLPIVSRPVERLIIRHGRTLDSAKEFEEIAQQTSAIDDEVYGPLTGFRAIEASMELAQEWVTVEPDIYTFLIDGASGRYIGYINAVFVTRATFERLMAEGVPDNQLLPASLASTKEAGSLCVCVLSIAVDPGARKLGDGIAASPVRRLLLGFCAKLEFLARHYRLRIEEIGAVGWTDEGRRICESIIRMPKIAEDPLGHAVFRLKLDLQGLRTQHRPFRPLLKVLELYRDLALPSDA